MNNTYVWQQLSLKDPASIALRSGAILQPDGALTIPILTTMYRVDIHTRTISLVPESTSREPESHLDVALLSYLIGAREIEPTGEWVSPRSFPGGIEFYSGPHGIPASGIIERFGNDKDGFISVCKHCGGEPIAYADAAFSFCFFPRLPVAVLLWLEDDEFPARASMLVDQTANQHLALDGLLGVMMVLEELLVRG